MSRVNRRKVIQALGAAGAIGLAGCVGADDPDDDVADDVTDDMDDDPVDEPTELGERFPDPFVLAYLGDLGGITAVQESIIPIYLETLGSLLEVEIDINAVDFTTLFDQINFDERTHHLTLWRHSPAPDRLDPQELTRRQSIDWAGNNGRSNTANYASCEYTHFAIAQEAPPDPETRERLAHRAFAIMSHHVPVMQTMPQFMRGAINPETTDLQGVGEAGLIDGNPIWWIESEPIGREDLRISGVPSNMEMINPHMAEEATILTLWGNLFCSPLLHYTRDLELENMMAEDFWTERNAATIGVEIKDWIFQDHSEVTAEDVAWTFDHLWSNPGAWPQGAVPPGGVWENEIIDERTVEFHFEAPWPVLITREWPRWGIVPHEHWIDQGAEDIPDLPIVDPMIGSGPYEIVDFEPGTFIDAEPFEDHPHYDPVGSIFWEAYRTEVTAVESFLAGNLDIIHGISPGATDSISAGMPEAEIQESEIFVPWLDYFNTSFGPSMFEALRKAIAMSLPRDLMLEVGEDVDPATATPHLHGLLMSPMHPFYPPDEKLYQLAPDMSGDFEGARQILLDRGFGWDDDGHFRYPADADLTPLWPEGQAPLAEDFDCVVDVQDNVPVFEPQWDAVEALEEPLENYVTVYGR